MKQVFAITKQSADDVMIFDTALANNLT